MGRDSVLKFSWGTRECALRQSFYEAPGICLGKESLIKETQQPFMFLIFGERGRVFIGTKSQREVILCESLSVQLCGIFTSDCEDQARK